MADPASIYSGFWASIYDFQTLIAGAIAVFAAAVTAIAVWLSARMPIAKRDERDRQLAARRKRHECLVLSSQLRVLRRRASQAMGTIRVHAAGNHDVSDATKERIYLAVPKVILDWDVMSLLPPETVDRCLDLTQKLDNHNYDISRAGGAFGADNFRDALYRRLNEIMAGATALANDLAAAARP